MVQGTARSGEGDKVKKLDEYRHSKPEHLSLFKITEPENKAYSNTIELYDAIPKYYWGNQRRDEEGRLKSIEREFKHKGVEYSVYIQPARLKVKDGKSKEYIPSQREELVEDALRKLACEGKGVFLDDYAGVTFTLYELQQELKQMGHGYKVADIKKAIVICAKSNMEVRTKDGKAILLANFFETVGLQTQEDWKGQGKKTTAYIRFNSLVTKSIKEKTFRLLNYNKSMSYKRVLARWLHKRLSHNYTQASSDNPFTIKLSTIIRDSGVKQYTELRVNIQEIKKALEEMVEKKVLSKYEVGKTCEGRKIIDASFTLFPHHLFISEVIYSNKRQKKMRLEEDREEERQERRRWMKKTRDEYGDKFGSEFEKTYPQIE